MFIFRRLAFYFLVPAVTLLGSIPFAHAAAQNRINAAISDSERATINGTIPARARRATDLGEAPAGRMLTSVGLHFNMTDAQQADLNQLLADQQNPSSPQYHQWLTPAQFGARFGVSSADLAKTEAWLSSKGLSITAVAPSLNYITVSGTVSQMESAFGTSIHSMSENGEQHISNVTDPTLPSAMAGVVSGVTGLNDFKLRTRAAVQPHYTSSISGSHYMAPGDIFTIYDVNPLINNGTTGNGITIAVMGQTDISTTDVDAFRNASSLPARTSSNFTIRLIPNSPDPGTVSGDIDEAQLDVEWANAAAPGSNILYVNSGTNNGVMDSLIYSITNRVAPIISISYGACESGWGQSNLNTFNQYFQQANAQGMTVVGPSGDSGATDCDFQLATATQGLSVDFPASSPYVTGAGGTMFNEGSGSYWSGSNGSFSGSALSYIPEMVWNESNSSGLASTGGGVSAYFSKPAWQIGNGVPADLSRDVPDISFNSASVHDGYLFCSRGSCTNGYRNASSNLNVVGGTSVATPVFAGFLALLEQSLSSKGLGNVNPMIYGLANSTYYNNVFHDVTSGNNNSACVVGTQDCPNGGSIGYSSSTGYDRATGWGSLDVANFVSKWPLVSPAGTGSGIGTVLSSTTVSTSGATCGISSGNVVLNIRVTGSGAVPSGTVQILVDNSPLSDPASNITLDGNGSATYTLNSSSIASGGHVVSAVYSGNSTFTGSKGTLPVDVVSSSQADFSLTPCQAATSARSGSTAAGVTLTLTPFKGFTGTINLTATANTSVASQFAFSVNPVTLSSGAVSTTLTISAFQSKAKTTSAQDITAQRKSSGMPPWYAATSGATLAGALLLTLPRRRRWGALLVVAISAAAFTAVGCGSGGGSSNSGSGSTTPVITNAAPGTYNITVTAVSGSLVHSTVVALTVQ